MITEKAFVDTSEWDKPRTLANMPGYLRSYGLGSKSSAAAQTKVATKPGSPHTLVITSAGLRAADATRYEIRSKFRACTHRLIESSVPFKLRKPL